MKTGAQIIHKYGNQDFSTDTLSLEEMIDNEMAKIVTQRNALINALEKILEEPNESMSNTKCMVAMLKIADKALKKVGKL